MRERRQMELSAELVHTRYEKSLYTKQVEQAKHQAQQTEQEVARVMQLLNEAQARLRDEQRTNKELNRTINRLSKAFDHVMTSVQ